jgi:hypothetical protein
VDDRQTLSDEELETTSSGSREMLGDDTDGTDADDTDTTDSDDADQDDAG